MVICLVYKWLKQLCSSDKWGDSVIDQVKKKDSWYKLWKNRVKEFQKFLQIDKTGNLTQEDSEKMPVSSLERTIREGSRAKVVMDRTGGYGYWI